MPPSAYVLGGNSNSVGFVCGLPAEQTILDVWLVPIAWTPVGVAVGEQWQRVGVALDNLPEWADQTFAANDERAFVAPVRELELLLRIGWSAAVPERLNEEAIVNPHDLPEDVLDGLIGEPLALTQCAICRRSCVREHFVWNERRLCAWDYHATVFGKRGPWRSEPYEERYFDTLPYAAYVVPDLLEEGKIDHVMLTLAMRDETARSLINAAIAADAAGPAHMAVRTENGYSLLRERA